MVSIHVSIAASVEMAIGFPDGSKHEQATCGMHGSRTATFDQL